MTDSGFGVTPQVTSAQLQSILTTTPPPSEATAAKVGSGTTAAREDHQHPRLTSATVQALDANSEAVITFTRIFAKTPAVTCLLYESTDNQVVTFKVKSWANDANGNFTGCTIKAYRSQILPALTGILLIGPLITALNNFNVFSGSASGANFSCIALQVSN
jgi:hypothetical protein